MAKELKKFIQNKDYYDQTVKILESTKEKLTGEDFSVPEYMSKVLRRVE